MKEKTRESSSEEGPNKERIDEFISSIAAPNPIPAGGSAAALAGTLAAALGEMMAGLTEGRGKFASVQPQVQEIHAKLTLLRKTLHRLVQEDSMAFKSLLNAIKLPKDTGEQRSARAEAIEKATRGATETPLRTARAAIEILENLNALIEIGNPNARCDVATGAQLAYASLKSGQYNILSNIRNLKDLSFANNCCVEISDLVRRGQEILKRLDGLVSGS